MARKRKRQPFQPVVPEDSPKQEKLIDTTSGIFGFMRDHGVRETIESIIVAIVLALMFRAYEAEAFIIPTGSMAPSLQGQHMDVVCEECNYQYRAGASRSASNNAPEQQAIVTKTFCPVCRYGMTMEHRNPDHHSNNGDRILVNKFVYDFQDPERFDVIVFKNPNNGKQNYIKRLVGLPGDRLVIDHGDIYNLVPDGNGKQVKQIVRKPEDKIDVMLQLVDDTNHISRKQRKANWPNRWSEWSDPDVHWKSNESDGKPFYEISASNSKLNWLRYRHLAPRPAFDESIYTDFREQRVIDANRLTEWDEIEKGRVPKRIRDATGKIADGALIRDHYEYNDRRYRMLKQTNRNQNLNANRRFFQENLSSGSHWVGDLAAEFEIEVKSEGGTIALDLVEGGVHFQCQIEIASGTATISTSGDNGEIVFDTPDGSPPTASTNLKGKGAYRIRYAQLDNMVYLWVNDRFAEFNGSSFTFASEYRLVPKFNQNDPGDAEPAGIASAGAEIRVNRLKVFRDVYYVAPVVKNERGDANIRNETNVGYHDLIKTYEKPKLWNSEIAKRIFERPREQGPVFELAASQYFPMGDNSPASQDARIWGGPHYVDEDYLIGRAMFIYWPHSLNRPVKYFPNFRRMGFIR